MSRILKPTLYAIEGTSAAPNYPSLKGGKCLHCGYVFFPLQTYGCEVCGESGAALQPMALSGCGTLIASAKVHIHAPPAPALNPDAKAHEAPFTIGSIKLDDGPTIRTLLLNQDERILAPGQRMVSKLVSVGSGVRITLDLRFTPAS
ncbi:hypothetical protein XI06_16600 [Bradyrhizobium sp. CCBAU 11434]|uniref:Zn-ribbon domain-containing OB-fold protein n=1 Tax=Bradyrhizobium sp. CCBAU 11434 TaxID=1630885 RepID=UPI00230637A2|nr:hypothetical protein [Bradyrhizobium sp. CCBAU 11434]MDA9521887.1 hypothetical protein [Bradyrhizobium sp. CCBAU 11434]